MNSLLNKPDTCSCCHNQLKIRKYNSENKSLSQNFLIKEDIAICFECAGLYLYDTYLKKNSYSELKTIVEEIRILKEKEYQKINTNIDNYII